MEDKTPRIINIVARSRSANSGLPADRAQLSPSGPRIGQCVLYRGPNFGRRSVLKFVQLLGQIWWLSLETVSIVPRFCPDFQGRKKSLVGNFVRPHHHAKTSTFDRDSLKKNCRRVCDMVLRIAQALG